MKVFVENGEVKPSWLPYLFIVAPVVYALLVGV